MKTSTVKMLAVVVVLAGSLFAARDAQAQNAHRPQRYPQVPPMPVMQPMPVYQPQQPTYQLQAYQLQQAQQAAYQQQQAYQQQLAYQAQQQQFYQPAMSARCVAGQFVGYLAPAYAVGTQCTVTDQFNNVYVGSVQ